MLDRQIGLTRPQPDNAASKPTECEARVERERTVDQPDHGVDILSEATQYESRVGKDARVVLRHLKRLSRQIAGLAPICLRRFGPVVAGEVKVADRSPR